MAHRAGARLRPACELVGIDVRTLQRWRAEEGLERGDRRPCAVCPTPAHALSAAERDAPLRVANEPLRRVNQGDSADCGIVNVYCQRIRITGNTCYR
jgi:hypothetical protein